MCILAVACGDESSFVLSIVLQCGSESCICSQTTCNCQLLCEPASRLPGFILASALCKQCLSGTDIHTSSYYMQGPAHAIQLWLHIYPRSNIAALQPFQSICFPYQFPVHTMPSILFSYCKLLGCLTYIIARTVLYLIYVHKVIWTNIQLCIYNIPHRIFLFYYMHTQIYIQQYSSLIHELACV